jgi:hypothetical protein
METEKKCFVNYFGSFLIIGLSDDSEQGAPSKYKVLDLHFTNIYYGRIKG